MNIGQAIKKLRGEKKIAQGELAKLISISQTSLSLIESNSKKPSSKTLKKIAEALKVPEIVIHLYSLEDSDVPETKKELFNELYPSLQGMVREIITESD